MGGYREQRERVLFYIGEIKNLPFFQTRKFSKLLKNQWKIYKFWENFQIYIQKSQWKTDFLPISLQSSRPFVISYTSGTFQNFWGWFGGRCAGLGGSLAFGGGVGVYKPMINKLNPCIFLFDQRLTWEYFGSFLIKWNCFVVFIAETVCYNSIFVLSNQIQNSTIYLWIHLEDLIL